MCVWGACDRVCWGGALITRLAIRAGAEFPSNAEPADREIHIGLPVNSRKV